MPAGCRSTRCPHWENLRERKQSRRWPARTSLEPELLESDIVSPSGETEIGGGRGHSHHPTVHNWSGQGSNPGGLIPEPVTLTVSLGTKCWLSLGQAPSSPFPVQLQGCRQTHHQPADQTAMPSSSPCPLRSWEAAGAAVGDHSFIPLVSQLRAQSTNIY